MRRGRTWLAACLATLAVGAIHAEATDCRTIVKRPLTAKPARTEIGPGVFRDAIVVKFTQPSKVRLRAGQLLALEQRVDLEGLDMLIADHPGLVIRRHFSRPEAELEEEKRFGERRICRELGDLNLYYLFDLSGVAAVEPAAFVDALNALPSVEIAYPLPRLRPAQSDSTWPWETRQGSPGNYEPLQTYLDPAPVGIDAEWAWGLTGGRGQGVDYIDIEYNWNLDHDDLPAASVTLPATYTSPGPAACTLNACDFDSGYAQHGTAVLGILSSLDNGVGTTGIAVDAGLGVLQWNAYSTWPNLSNAISTASANLGVGDIIIIEMQGAGPTSGETCTCVNCNQFESVPVEYWQDTFDAIQLAVSNGRIVVEAAGNGSMDLDHSRYGGKFDRQTRDSLAILVAAGLPGNHGAECFTNSGSRIDLQGYGSGIYTTGYGDIFPGHPEACVAVGDCNLHYDELYIDNFDGTSGATPIVAGAAAILQGVSKQQGYTLWPQEVRDILPINATPQPTPFVRPIGPLPNLRGCIRADLEPYDDPGWDYPLVPRGDAAVASCLNVPLPATLPGNSPSTYFNALAENSGVLGTPGFSTEFFVDDLPVLSVGFGGAPPATRPCGIDLAASTPLEVRGGRHTVRVRWDGPDDVPEWFEDNNEYIRQFVWSPLPLVKDVPVGRPAPPDRNTEGWVHYNNDGFEIQIVGDEGGWWGGVGMIPADPASDFDLRLHDDYAGSETGFGAAVAASYAFGNRSDFVLVNGNNLGLGATRWVGAFQANPDPDPGAMMLHYSEGASVSAPGSHGPYHLAPEQLLEVLEVYFDPSQVGLYFDFTLRNLDPQDLGISLFAPGLDYAGPADHLPGGYADSGFGGEDESFTVQINDPGYYALVVWKYDTNDLPLSGDFVVEISPSLPNLAPTVGSNWSDAVVPKASATCALAGCQIDPSLPDGGSTYWNYHFSNAGLNPFTREISEAFWNEFRVDGNLVSTVGFSGTFEPGGGTVYLNDGPYVMRGGRHTASLAIDVQDTVEETNEDDNSIYRQFVWAPFILSTHGSYLSPHPPDFDSAGWVYPNCHGYEFYTDYWSSLAVTPVNVWHNFDLRLHDDYVDSQTGFELPLVASTEPAGITDFVLTNAYHPAVGLGSAWFGGVIQANSTPDEGEYHVGTKSTDPPVAPPAMLPNHGLPAIHLVKPHDLEFSPAYAGRNFVFELLNQSGAADLGMGLYAGDQPYLTKADAMASANSGGAGENELFLTSIPFAGSYALAVWKNGSADVMLGAGYSVRIDQVLPFVIAPNSLRLEGDPDRNYVNLHWGPDCNTVPSTGYTIYGGNLHTLRTGSYDYSGLTPICQAGTDMYERVLAGTGDMFFVVVPNDDVFEGLPGEAHVGPLYTTRPSPAAGVQCLPTNSTGSCAY